MKRAQEEHMMAYTNLLRTPPLIQKKQDKNLPLEKWNSLKDIDLFNHA
jgi:hypothetical protein